MRKIQALGFMRDGEREGGFKFNNNGRLGGEREMKSEESCEFLSLINLLNCVVMHWDALHWQLLCLTFSL